MVCKGLLCRFDKPNDQRTISITKIVIEGFYERLSYTTF